MKLSIPFISLLFMIFAMTACGQNSNNNLTPHKDVVNLSSDDFETTLFADDSKENVILIDVRTPNEFSQGHIKGAINLDVNDKKFLKNASKALKHNPDRVAPTLAIYCRSGVRSVKAANMLLEEGYAKKVYNLEEGILGWKGEVVK